MSQRYSIRTIDYEKWIVSADDEDVLTCSRLTDAVKTVKHAMHALEPPRLSTSDVQSLIANIQRRRT
jgi:hypothetical protein